MITTELDPRIREILSADSNLLGENIPNLGDITLMLLAMRDIPAPSELLLAYIWKVCPWYTHTADDMITKTQPHHMPMVQLVRSLAKQWGYSALTQFDVDCRRAWQRVCDRDS